MHTTDTSFVASSVQEQNKQVVRQFFEAFDRHDTERIGQLVSSTDYTFHFLGMPPMDWNGHKQFIIAITNAFPDVHHEIVDIVLYYQKWQDYRNMGKRRHNGIDAADWSNTCRITC